MIGIRPQFEGGSVPENARAGFEVIALDAEGKRIALSGLTISWVREDTTYQWFQSKWRLALSAQRARPADHQRGR